MRINVCSGWGNLVRVELEGDLDLGTAPEVRRKLMKLARRKMIQILELDFSRVTSVDTAGVAVLVELMRSLAQKRGRLELTGLNESIRRMIRLTRLEAMFHIQSSDSIDGT